MATRHTARQTFSDARGIRQRFVEKGLRTMSATLSPYQALLVEFVPRPIRSDREYKKSLRQIERLMTAKPTREQGELIDVLATLIEQYEAADHPTPKLPPRELIAHYLENRGLTRAELARKT